MSYMVQYIRSERQNPQITSSRAVNKYSKFKYIFKYLKEKKIGDSIVKMNIRLWKKTHQWLLCQWAHNMTGQGQVTGFAPAQRHSLLKVRRTETVADADGREKKRYGRKFRAQLGIRESGLDSKHPKKPLLEILQILVSRQQKCGSSR